MSEIQEALAYLAGAANEQKRIIRLIEAEGHDNLDGYVDFEALIAAIKGETE